MKKISRSFLLVATVVALMLTVGCASSQSAGEVVDDAAITASVKTRMAADPEINPFNIDVDTTDGVVRLSGTVDDAKTRREAVEIAEGTKNVRRVIDEIEVGEKTIGESAADASIVARVKTRLAADPDVNPFTIDVDSDKGTVTLSGTVNTRAQSREAEEIAAGTDGVDHVHNRLKIDNN